MKKGKIKLSKISAFHYLKLVFRSLLFIGAVVIYVVGRVKNYDKPFGKVEDMPVLLSIIWVVFVIEIILRFFPSDIESMGCQKQFSKNYIAKEYEGKPLTSWKSTLAVALSWLLLNGGIGALYLTGLIDEGILLIISLAYSVCDMICILFFCPFQTWFMKNKCCGSCRIYNWDYAMMCTPLVFINNVYTISLTVLAFMLFITWEITIRVHPERFSENTNECLSCKNCKEKLCHHKSQLRSFLKKNKDILILKGNAIIEKTKKSTDALKAKGNALIEKSRSLTSKGKKKESGSEGASDKEEHQNNSDNEN